MLSKINLRNKLFSFPLIREILFFVFRKKMYKKIVNKKILLLFKGEKKLNGIKLDKLIVSLTSFPERIAEIKYAIFSLLDQTILPGKIILWLAESQFPNKEKDLPEELLIFKKFGLVINWCEDLRSYKKLVPTLKKFPNHYMVTADDDLYYKKKWLEKLWFEHLKYPNDVICHLAARVSFMNKDILSYVKWERYIKKECVGYNVFGCSGGGILFHKDFLYEDVVNTDLFLNLAPYADDIWFYFMTIMNGTMIRVVRNPYTRVKYINPYREYGLKNGYKLATINVDSNFNDRQIKNIIDHYQVDLFSLLNKKFA